MADITQMKLDLIEDIKQRVNDKILEESNAALLIKLIRQADDDKEAIAISALGTTYKRTGLHFDKRLDKPSSTIKFLKKNTELSFTTDVNKPIHKLIIGDNYDALLNLLVQYRGKNKLDTIIDEDEIYSGVWAWVCITFYGYKVNGKCGIAAALEAVRKCKDDEQFGGSVSQSEAFGNIPMDDEDDEDL